MRRTYLWVVILAFYSLANSMGSAAEERLVSDDGRVQLEAAFGGLRFDQPVALVQAPGETSRWFIAEQDGTVRVVERASGRYRLQLAIDLRARVIAGGEMGLLGIAFHPAYPGRPEVFLSYTGSGPDQKLRSIVSRFRIDPSTGRIDPLSEEGVLTVAQPYQNHNGGQITFGPDGYLYMGLGDGGGAGDPHGHAQNLNTLLGAFLRLDVDSARPYAIPADNPFVAGGGLPEIYAYGLRNPWRWSFDRETGALWAGDVGQNAWEEIDLIVKGGNYGWNIMEGRHCFRSRPCRRTGLIDPIAEYSHQDGYSVIGGYVYRGQALPGLRGRYLFGDFGSGKFWTLREERRRGWVMETLFSDTGLQITSFAEDAVGELYLLAYNGTVYRLAPAKP